MKNIPWPELKEKLLKLKIEESPVYISQHETVVDEKKFIDTHIATIDSAPRKDDLTNREKAYRLFVVKPHYDRLLAYYLLKTQL
jgi:hypothetical protein